MTGAGYNDQGEIRIHNCDVMETAWQSIYRLLEVGCLCNNAKITNDTLLGQPTEGALLVAGMKVAFIILLKRTKPFLKIVPHGLFVLFPAWYI